MDYIYLSDLPIKETKEKIESKKITLQDTNPEDRIWILNKKKEVKDQETILEKSKKVGV